jgi:hypothetical protein
MTSPSNYVDFTAQYSLKQFLKAVSIYVNEFPKADANYMKKYAKHCQPQRNSEIR